ncbi:MAG TPA: hypothetical protein DHV36_17545 [Desulfobacteraceae bacterium]|nr:hypothetical protein [Desulfobacteraceae bacterium]
MIIEILVGVVLVVCLAGLIFRFSSMFRLGRVFDRDRDTLAAQVFKLDYFGTLFNTLFQVRLFRAGKLRWLAHTLVLTGFLFLLGVHALDFWTGELWDWYQPGIAPFRFLRNLAGVMVTVGAAAFLFRRLTPSRINRDRLRRGRRFRVRGTLSIIALLGLMASGFVTEALNIISEPRFDEMVETFSDISGEPELVHLQAYWEKHYYVVFDQGFLPAADLSADLDEGRELNEAYCLECHALPDPAFVSVPIARAVQPLGFWSRVLRLDRVFYWLHFGLAMVLLVCLPFSRMFHIIAIPLATARRRMTPDTPRTDMGFLDLAGLSACTHCGFCSQVCSVTPDYLVSDNPQVLPHMKLDTLKRLAGKGVWDLNTLVRLRSGNDDCTRCGLCADICPSGIDLVRLWTTADTVMDRMGCPDNYTTAMDASFREWVGPETPDAASLETIQHLPGDVAVRNRPDTLSGLIADADTFEHCVQCTLCTNTCPVAAYDLDKNDFGPHQVMNLLRLGEGKMASGTRMVWHCLTCYACQEVCPQSIRVADIMLELRCRGQERAAELTIRQLKGAS